MKKRLLFVCLGLIFLVGCSESQMKQGDKLATGVQNTGTAIQSGLQSPAGALIPEPFRSLSEIVVAGLLLVAGGWQTYRKSQVSAALDDLGVAAAGTTGKSILETPTALNINPSTMTELKALGH